MVHFHDWYPKFVIGNIDSKLAGLKYREIVRRREETTGHSVRSKWNWGLLFVRPEWIGVRSNCNFVQKTFNDFETFSLFLTINLGPYDDKSCTCTCRACGKLYAILPKNFLFIVQPIREIVGCGEETTGHSVRPKWNWGLLFVRPEWIGVRPNCNFVQRQWKCTLVQD